ncbi:MAG: metalloregulator ArsR/SmtB family transcription factor [Anaerolineales bacterium]|nr:metalloregulator ArsR/SmtB family transcription factor [Anaerolineales bacterium]
MNSPASADLERRAALFKALGHPVRLLILNLIHAKPRHGEELALILSLNPATVSHHLTLLSDAGLLAARKDQYYQTYSLVGQLLKKTLAELVFMQQADLPRSVEVDAYRKKVLATFMRHGRVTKIPAQLKKRQVILEKIAEAFEPGQPYPEREVNIILLDFNDDVAALRRGLVEAGLITRKDNVYHRKIS